MWTRTSDRWNVKPGSWDKLNMQYQFPSSNKYGIPDLIAPSLIELPEPPTCLIPYNIRVRSEMGYVDAAMHFFMDDYRFELAWSNPNQVLLRVKKAWLVLTPDFSIYADWPMVAQIWNTYRSRWCGAYWRNEGLVVVPSVTWGNKESYDFCFEGIEFGSPVAISTQGINFDDDTKVRFESGYSEMISRINPRFVICYGKLENRLKNLYQQTIVKCYPTYWEGLKKARRLGIPEDFYSGATTIHNGEY